MSHLAQVERAAQANVMSDQMLNQEIASLLYGTMPYTIPDFCQNMAFAWLVFQQLVIDQGNATITMDMENYGRESGDIGTVEAGGWSLTKRVPRAICEVYFIAIGS